MKIILLAILATVSLAIHQAINEVPVNLTNILLMGFGICCLMALGVSL